MMVYLSVQYPIVIKKKEAAVYGLTWNAVQDMSDTSKGQEVCVLYYHLCKNRHRYTQMLGHT